MQIIKVFQDKNVPLAIAIVGNLFGQDKALISFIKERTNMAHPKLAISNHGWNHEDFRRFNIDNQSILIKRTNQRIYETLGILPSLFIPPFDVFNNDTLTVLAHNGMKVLSSSTKRDLYPYATIDLGTPYHFPATATTSNNNETHWIGLTHVDTIDQINKSVKKYGFAVVEMHPYEYSNKHTYSYKPFYLTEKEGTFVYSDFIKNWDNVGIDNNQIKDLQLLLDQLLDKGYNIVSLDEMIQN